MEAKEDLIFEQMVQLSWLVVVAAELHIHHQLLVEILLQVKVMQVDDVHVNNQAGVAAELVPQAVILV